MSRADDLARSINRVDSSAADATAITIDSNENVGFGTTSPNKSSSNTATAANYSAIELASGDTLNWYMNANNAAVYDATQGTRARTFYTNGSERMRIDSYGNLKVQRSDTIGDIGAKTTFAVANGSTVGLTPTGSSNAGALLIHAYQSTDGRGAIFYADYAGTVTKIAGHADWTNADTASKYCVYKTGGSHDVTLKNNIGSSKDFAVLITKAIG